MLLLSSSLVWRAAAMQADLINTAGTPTMRFGQARPRVIEGILKENVLYV